MALTTLPRTAQVTIAQHDLINEWTVTRPVWPAVKQLRVSNATRPQAEGGAVRGAEGAQPGAGCSSGRLSRCCCREKLSG